LHDAPPHLGGGVAVDVYLLRLVEAGPDDADVVGRVAGEPAVPVVGGGAGLARYGLAGEHRLRARAVVGGAVQHVGNVRRGAGLHGDVGLGLVVKDEVAGGVRDLGIGPGLGEDTGIVEGAVGLRHLQDAYAVREL